MTEREQIGEFARGLAKGQHGHLAELYDYMQEREHPLTELIRRAHERGRPSDWGYFYSPEETTNDYDRPQVDFGGDQPADPFEDKRPFTTAYLSYSPSGIGKHHAVIHFGEHAPGVRPYYPYRHKIYPVPVTPEEMESVANALHERHQSPDTAEFLDAVKKANRNLADTIRGPGYLIHPPEPDRYSREIDRILPSYFDSGPVLFPDRRVLIKPVA